MAYLVLFRLYLYLQVLRCYRTLLLSHQPRSWLKETAIASKLLSLRLWYINKGLSPNAFPSWCPSVHSWALIVLAKVKNLSEPIDLSMSNWISAQHFQGTGRGQEALHTPEREDSGEIKIMALPEALMCRGKCRQGVPWRLLPGPWVQRWKAEDVQAGITSWKRGSH